MQERRFVGGANLLVLEKFVDLVLAKLVVDLVGIVAGKYERLVTDPPNRMGDIRLEKGRRTLTLSGTKGSGSQIAEFRLLMLTRLDP